MKTLRYLNSAVLTLVAVVAVAGDAQAGGCTSGYCDGFIREIWIKQDSTDVRVRLDHDTSPGGCTLQSGTWWWVDNSDLVLIQNLLTAHLARWKVTLRRASATGECRVGWAIIEEP